MSVGTVEGGIIHSDSLNQIGTSMIVPFAEYTYNENSQLSTHNLCGGSIYNSYTYNNRNWVENYGGNLISCGLEYNPNGNVNHQTITGDYQSYLSDTKAFDMFYTYDQSNRLTNVQSQSERICYEFTGTYIYDHDGNFISHYRSSNGDNLHYEYYSGTNRLKKIEGDDPEFTYYYNGNLLTDNTKSIYDIKYDSRNLITEFKRNVKDFAFKTEYKYDEAGNRTQKLTKYLDRTVIFGNWKPVKLELYSRDISGKEIAVYEQNLLEQEASVSQLNQQAQVSGNLGLKFYNVWGNSNEGQIYADNTKYFYLKDHLGTVRAVYDVNLNIMSALRFW